MQPIGWGLALLVWGYALAWFVINDQVKVMVLRRMRRAHEEPAGRAGVRTLQQHEQGA
jgi:H+-transporting ATPase